MLCLAPMLLAAQAPGRLVRTEPLLRIGDDASPVSLGAIGTALFDARSRLLVADNSDGAVLTIDANGREVARFGRTGAGPGEFRTIDHMGWTADTLWIYDGTLRRVTFVHGGRLLRVDATQPRVPAGLASATPLSVGRDGTEFGLAAFARGAPPRGLPGHLLYRRRRGAAPVDTVMWLARRNSALVLQINAGGQASQLRGTQPLDDAPLVVGRHAGGFVVIDRPAAAQRGESTVTVRAFDAIGAPAFQTTFAVAAVPVTEAIRAEVRSRLCVSRRTPAAQRMCTDEEADRALWFPPVLAPASGATGCSDGALWVRLADAPFARAQEYQGFSAEGKDLGRLRLEPNAHILDCRGDRVAVAVRTGTSFDPLITIRRVLR